MIITGDGVLLSRAEVRALLAHACTDLTRSNMACVVLNPVRLECAATDGQRLAMLRAATGDAKPAWAEVCVPRGDLELAAKLAGPKAETVHIIAETRRIIVFTKSGRDVSLTFEPPKSERPKYETVEAAVPNAPVVYPRAAFSLQSSFLADLDLVTAALQSSFLADLDLVTAAAGKRMKDVVIAAPGGKREPACVTVDGPEGRWKILIMPTLNDSVPMQRADEVEGLRHPDPAALRARLQEEIEAAARLRAELEATIAAVKSLRAEPEAAE